MQRDTGITHIAHRWVYKLAASSVSPPKERPLMPIVLCPHGNPTDDYVEVTTYGDKRPVYLAATCDCPA